MFNYDIALSFAGEDRTYVDEVANILHQLGVKVFYDKYEEAELWGKDLYVHLDNVYQRESQFCVMFISKHYKEKLWTNHERESAQAKAFNQNKEYILPVRFDNTEIPGIRPTTGYLDLRSKTPSELAKTITKKLGLDTEHNEMIKYLSQSLEGYDIVIDGTNLLFTSSEEDYCGSFPVRLLLEMYRVGEIENMFIHPSIVPN